MCGAVLLCYSIGMTQNEFQPEENQTPLTTRLTLAAPARLQGVELQTFLRDKLNRVKTRTRRCGIGAIVVMTSGLLTAPLCVMIGYPDAAWYCFFGLPFPLYALLVLGCSLTRKAVQAEIEDMEREAGIQAVGTLFEMLRCAEEPQVQTTIHHALTRLLPQMTPADANLLTPYARQTMRGWLSAFNVAFGMKGRLNNLRVASLKALEHIGESRDIPVVERLTEMNLRVCDEWDVQATAIHCLPILRANCAEVEAARTLLRASQAEDARSDTLLRPAGGAEQTDSAELLRGADAPDAP